MVTRTTLLTILFAGFALILSNGSTAELDTIDESDYALEQVFSGDHIEQGRVLEQQSGTEVPVTFTSYDGLAVIEGDVVLGTPAQVRGYYLGLDPAQYAYALSVANTGSLWPLGVLPYQIHPDLNSGSLPAKIASAMAHISGHTSVLFVQRNAGNAASYPDYVEFVTSTGCASYVGRTGGRQNIWLAEACSTGNVIHELGHALGLYHEQGRNDRDSYVSIHWGNIQSGKSHNFVQQLSNAIDQGSYDYGSIMHYGAYAFSNNGSPTITTINPAGAFIGQRSGLSTGDISALNSLYATDLSMTLQASPTVVNPAALLTLSAHVTNLLGTTSRGLTLTVPIPANSTYTGASGDQWTCNTVSTNLVCNRAELSGSSTSVVEIYLTAPGYGFPWTLSGQISGAVTDNAPGNNSDTVDVIVNSQNFAPVITNNQLFEIHYLSENGAAIGKVDAIDYNGDALQDFQINNGAMKDAVAINTGSGEIKLIDSSLLNMEAMPEFTLGITVSDGTLTSSITDVRVRLVDTQQTNSTSSGGGGAIGALALIYLLLLILVSTSQTAVFRQIITVHFAFLSRYHSVRQPHSQITA